MKKRILALATALLCTTTAVWAQPDPNNGGQAENPVAAPPAAGGGFGDFRNMTPEQRQKMMQQFRDNFIRSALTHVGLTDTEKQQAVLDNLKERETGGKALTDASRALQQALAKADGDDAAATKALEAFRAAA